MSLFRFFVLMVTAALLAGCATGPKFAEVQSSIVPVARDKGRIYFYRQAEMGLAVQPTIYVNGVAVGQSQPDGFFYVDHAPGKIEVKTETEVEEATTFTLASGQTRYVRTRVGIGLFVGRVYPEVMADEQGASDIRELNYTGGRQASR